MSSCSTFLVPKLGLGTKIQRSGWEQGSEHNESGNSVKSRDNLNFYSGVKNLMVKKTSCLLLFLLFVTISCFKEQPTQVDSSLNLTLFVKFEDRFLNSIPVTIKTYDYNIVSFSGVSDSCGAVSFENIPWAEYLITIKSSAIVTSALDSIALDTVTVIASTLIIPPEISNNESNITDTIYTIASGAQPGLKINELYTVGPPNRSFYFYDQFIELYNSSSDTIYLDGMVICRMWHMLESVTYIFQFPGEPLIGREYPVPPETFVVVAQDAIDHTNIPNLPLPESVDLSHADWEFRNSADYGDSDNLDVPNLDNIEVGYSRDFMIALTMDVVLIADGSDLDYIDGMDIESVIDGVEYASFSTHLKDIEKEVDRGFGGIGLTKYSGQSLERVAAGFDSNNSTVDFEILDHPTPGYQHE